MSWVKLGLYSQNLQSQQRAELSSQDLSVLTAPWVQVDASGPLGLARGLGQGFPEHGVAAAYAFQVPLSIFSLHETAFWCLLQKHWVMVETLSEGTMLYMCITSNTENVSELLNVYSK